MMQLISDTLGSVYRNNIVVKMQDGIWAACTPVTDQEEGSPHLLQTFFKAINQQLYERFAITISLAVSEAGYSVRDIPYLYAQVLTIHSYRYLLGQNRIITMDDIREQEEKKYSYPQEAEKKLLSFLFAGKDSETDNAYADFVAQVKTFPVGEVKLSFMLLAYAIKNASNNTTAEVSSTLMEFDQFYKKLQMLETIEEVNQLFRHMFGEIVSKLKGLTAERYETLIDQIKQYVGEHYGQISLSMNEVSDYVDMSAAYLGRLFKQVTGISFTEYLTTYRLQTACDLLLHSDKTVNEISDEVGFTNSSYFYIVFKKNIGCTPSQYRKQQVNE
jgi:AraC-like DNA-binding protein